ncbi:MAG: PRC-barrel domain-containing protein [Rhodospirillaceae bacterium]
MRFPFLAATAMAAAVTFGVPAMGQSGAIPHPGAKPDDESALQRDYEARDQSIIDGGQTAMADPAARPEELAGLMVHDASGEKVGTVAGVRLGSGGEIDALIVARGEDDLKEIDWRNAQVDDDRVILDMTAAQVSGLPDFESAPPSGTAN